MFIWDSLWVWESVFLDSTDCIVLWESFCVDSKGSFFASGLKTLCGLTLDSTDCIVLWELKDSVLFSISKESWDSKRVWESLESLFAWDCMRWDSVVCESLWLESPIFIPLSRV